MRTSQTPSRYFVASSRDGAIPTYLELRKAEVQFRGIHLTRTWVNEGLGRFANRVVPVKTWALNAYSKELRLRMLEAVDGGLSREEVSELSGSPARPSNAG
jgi:hypothetical protein